MSYYTELAKEFKRRDNRQANEPTLGQVVSLNPVKISIFNDQVLLTENLIVLSNDFCVLTGTCTVDGKSGTCDIDRTLKQGEEVKCIPTSNGQRWFIMR